MDCATGAMACLTASRNGEFAVGLLGYPALFIARTSGVSAISSTEVLLSRVMTKFSTMTAAFIAACLCPFLASVGCCRWAIAPTFAHVITSAAAAVMTASLPYAVARVHSRRNSVSLYWRRGLGVPPKGFRILFDCITTTFSLSLSFYDCLIIITLRRLTSTPLSPEGFCYSTETNGVCSAMFTLTVLPSLCVVYHLT